MAIDHLKIQKISLLVGPIVAVSLAVLMLSAHWSMAAAMTAGVTALCAIWWVTEAIPIPVTSLLPMALFPMTGILSSNDVAQAYGSPLILLLLGGFILSTTMARSNTHRQIALTMVNAFGGESPRRIVFGFMAASACLSMWISNTATTLMLLPIALAVLHNTDDKKLTAALLLGICYSASVGGMGTPIGTPPNLIFREVYETSTGNSVGFLQWMQWAVPIVIIFVPVIALYLCRNLNRHAPIVMPASAKWTVEQKRIMLVFAITALAWMTRKEPFGGWSMLLGVPKVNDASVVLITVVLMFLIPNGKGDKLLDWETASNIPWGLLLLFAGGITIAKAFTASGLAEGMAQGLSSLTSFPVFIMIICICFAVTFLTEITSNTATTTLLMPILAVAGAAANIDPVILMVPAAMSASCAFMLPVATAPNAIIFGSGKVSIQTMVKTGLVLNVVGVGVISVLSYWSLA